MRQVREVERKVQGTERDELERKTTGRHRWGQADRRRDIGTG